MTHDQLKAGQELAGQIEHLMLCRRKAGVAKDVHLFYTDGKDDREASLLGPGLPIGDARTVLCDFLDARIAEAERALAAL